MWMLAASTVRRSRRHGSRQAEEGLRVGALCVGVDEPPGLVRLRRLGVIFGEASRRFRAGDRRTAMRYLAAAAGTGGLIRSFRVGLRLVKVELGRRRLGVTVPR